MTHEHFMHSHVCIAEVMAVANGRIVLAFIPTNHFLHFFRRKPGLQHSAELGSHRLGCVLVFVNLRCHVCSSVRGTTYRQTCGVTLGLKFTF